MALLGKFIDKIRASYVAPTTGTDGYSTLRHSLGAVPNLVQTEVVSIALCSCPPVIGALTGHSLFATTAIFNGSLNLASCPVVGFDLVAWVVHSVIK